MPRRSSLPSIWLALFLVPVPGCFGACSPSIPDAEIECDEDTAAPAGAEVVLLDEEGEVLADGTELELDYGPQGGQHFYVSLRAFPSGDPDEFLVASFEGEDGTRGDAQYFFVDGCAGWTSIEGDILQVNKASATSGLLVVELGHCDGSCIWEDNRPSNFVIRAGVDARISIVP